jgi:hypothetical protein
MTTKEIREALVKRIQERLDDENIKKFDDKLADYSNRYGDKKIKYTLFKSETAQVWE